LENNNLVEFDSDNIIVESIKKSQKDDDIIIRFYDAGKIGKNINLKINNSITAVYETNLLEEIENETVIDNGITSMYVKPFEIKTLKCRMKR